MVRPGLGALGIELIAAYSPQARGRSERMFGTLQKRLLRRDRHHGRNRFLEELFWPAHNAPTPMEPEGHLVAMPEADAAWQKRSGRRREVGSSAIILAAGGRDAKARADSTRQSRRRTGISYIVNRGTLLYLAVAVPIILAQLAKRRHGLAIAAS